MSKRRRMKERYRRFSFISDIEAWDEVIIARYPSISAFIEMNRDKEYQKNVRYRHEALIDSRLYLMKADKTDVSLFKE
jgi:hypothetical protein